MNAVKLLTIIAAAALIVVTEVHAADDEAPRILVTFADPGMSNAARAGPVRPGYGRRLSGYLVSVGVKQAANRVARDFDLEVIDEWPIVPLKVHCLLFAVSSGASVDSLLDELRKRSEVESAQLLNQFEVGGSPHAGSADPYFKLQHNLETLGLAQAHAWSVGNGANVSIIDTGADIRHPDLKSQISTHQDFVANSIDDFDADAHGTAVAGIIGAAVNGVGMVGVAPAAHLSVLRACWYTGDRKQAVCDSFTLAKALTYALESSADIINLSLGGPSDALLSRLLGLALDRGIVVVAAAPATQRSGFPSEVQRVIVVGSEPGEVEQPLIAPGEEILVPVPGGGFDYASGNSLSAAHVSGVIALLISKQPELSRDDVVELLVASRTNADESVNACRALAALLQRTGCRADMAARLTN